MTSSNPHIAEIIAQSSLAQLDPSLIEQLLLGSQRIDITRHTTIHYDAEYPRCALVLSGVIRMYMAAADGRQNSVLRLYLCFTAPACARAEILHSATLRSE